MIGRDTLSLIKRWLLFFFGVCLMLPAVASAQGIWDVSLTLNPFPSPYISDWESNPTAVGQATIFNNGDEGQEVILFVTLFKSDVGQLVEAESSSIFVGGMGSRTVNNTEFIEFSSADYTNSSIKNQVFRTGRLPEGVYNGCIQVRNRSGANLSPQRCQEFEIVYPDPPQLISPANTAEITTDFPTFQWIPVNVPAEFDIFYTFKVVEILEPQTPLRALEANVPLLERSDVTSSTLTYPIDGLSFEEGKTYAWQVQALDQFGLAPASNQGRSEIFTFTYRPETEEEEEEPIASDTSAEPCGGECIAGEPTGSPSGRSFSPGDELQIGHFVMTVTDATGTGSNLSGEGEIQVPFLNDVRISVAFENLTVNDAGVVLSGTATATEDIPSVTWSDVETTVSGSPVSVPSPSPEEAEVFHDIFEGGERVVSALTGDRAMGMPLGFSSSGTAGIGYTVGITQMVFGPRQANLNAMLTFEIPSLGNKMIALGSSGICFTPGGLGEQGRLYLAQDWDIVQEGDVRFALDGLADASGDTTSVTYAEWDCEGFDCVNVRGSVEFPEDKLLKENEAGSVVAGPVTGDFSFKTCDGRNLLAQIDIDPFRVSGISGWGFRVEDAWLDFSDTENPADFTLPENYEDPSLSDPRFETAWTGFYLKLAQLNAPEGFGQTGRANVAVHDLIIDGTGVTASIRAEDMISYSDGTMKGWAFSLDTIELNILQNGFESGGFDGELGLPISEDRLGYSSTLSLSEDDNIHYDFVVGVVENYSVGAWKAEFNLDAGSNITFEYNQGADDPVTLSALLHGNLNIQANNLDEVPGLSFNGIEFQNLYVGTEDPYFNVGDTGVDGNVFGLASPQKKVVTSYDDENGSTGGFPVTVDNIELVGGPTRPGIQFTTEIILVDQVGFAASFTLGIYGKLTVPAVTGDRFSFAYDGIDPKQITLSIPDFKGFSLNGVLNFYGSGSSTRKGVSGTLEVGIPMGLTVDLQADFGRTTEAHSEGEFSYWYINGLVTFSSGIDLFSGFALYGFGGGVYHHLSGVESTFPADKTSMIPADMSGGDGEANPDSLVSRGAVHDLSPTQSVFLGFKLKAVMGIKGEPKSFNMDVTFEVAIGEGDAGIQYISIDGNGYIMRDIEETEGTGKVWAHVDLDLVLNDPDEPGKKYFSGGFKIYVKVDNDLFYLRGPKRNEIADPPPDFEDYQFTEAAFYADNRGKWYLHMPPPSGGQIRRNVLKAGIDAKIAELGLDFKSYLLVGHDIPAGLPPLPPEIANVLGVEQHSSKASTTNTVGASERERSETKRNNKMDDFAEGKGFATGVQVDFDARFDFAIFYALLELNFGFDVSFLKVNQPCAENPGGGLPGVNGFYGQGQVYARLYGEVGIHIDLFFINKDIPIIGLGAAFALQGKFPNPTWFQGRVGLEYVVLGGLISGTTRFKIEAGQECTLTTSTSPFGDMEFVEEVEPAGEDVSVYTDPVAYFNLPVAEYIEIPADEKGEEVHTYEAFIESFTLTNTDTGDPITNPTTVPSEDGYSARLIPENFLDGRSNFEAEITVSAWEHFPDKPKEQVIVINEAGAPVLWRETKGTDFITEPAPNKIEDEIVEYSYPIERQNYFLPGETSGNKGIIQLTDGAGDLFDGSIDINQDGTESSLTENIGKYVVRFTQLESREETEIELTYSTGRTIELPLPDLENGKHYAVQVIAKLQPDVSMLGDSFSSVDLAGSLFNRGYSKDEVESYFKDNGLDFGSLEDKVTGRRFQDVVHEEFAQTTVTAMGVETDKYASTVNVDFRSTLAGGLPDIPETLPGGDQVKENEHLLFDFYFRTSKFNTLAEKMSGVNLEATHYPEYDGYLFYYLITDEGFDINMDLEEPFDEFDLYGLSKEVIDDTGEGLEFRQTLGPLVRIFTDESNEYFDRKADRLYSLYNQLKLLKDRTYGSEKSFGYDFYGGWQLKCMPLIGTYDYSDYHYGNTINKEETLSSLTIEDDSDILDPLPTWVLENAAGLNQPPPVSSSSGESDEGTVGGDLSLSPEGNIAGGTLTSNPLLSGFLNGSFNQVSITGSTDYHFNLLEQGESSVPIYNLHLFYDVVNEVNEDADDLRTNLSWIFGGYEVANFVFIHNELRYRGDSNLRARTDVLGMWNHCRWSGLQSEFIDFFMQEYEGCKDAWYCDPKEDVFIHTYKTGIRRENYSAYQNAYELMNDEWDFSLPRGTYNIKFNYHFPGPGELGSASFYNSSVNKSFEY